MNDDAPANGRLFTDAELAELARSPRDTLALRLAAGDVTSAEATVVSTERAFSDQLGGQHAWLAHALDFVALRHHADGLALLAPATRRFFAVHPDARAVTEEPPASVASEVLARATAGDHEGALAAYDDASDAWRRLQDVYRDWISLVLSHVYRTYGVDELEAIHRHAAERTLLPWMPNDIARPPEKRLARWVLMLQGHFSGIRIEEDDEKFTIVQDPCGTCARQILDGRYESPVSLAVVAEEHTCTWQRGNTPIYRTHVPVWHVAMAREQIGVPWPVNRCPAGLGTGPCPTLLYKDPRNPAADAQVP